jgi:hypothetical protein
VLLQLPLLTLSVWPWTAEPLSAGAFVLMGARPATVPLGLLASDVDP